MIQTLATGDSHYIGADTETTSLNWWDGEVVGHCFASRNEGVYRGFYVPVRHQIGENIEDVEECEALLKEEIWENHDLHKILWNVNFDRGMLKNHNIDLVNGEDGMLLYFLLNENARNHRLKDTAALHIDPDAVLEQDIVKQYIKQHNCPNYAYVPPEILGPYGAKDAVYDLALWNRVWPNRLHTKEDSLNRDGVRESIYKHELHFSFLVGKMERAGVPFDSKRCEALAQPVREAKERLEEDIWEMVLDLNENIKPCNLNSDVQLAALMEQLNIKPINYSKKTGKANWGRGELFQIPNRKLGEHLAAYRNLAHNLDAFLEVLPKHAERSGRIHCGYNQIGTRTGRASSSNPNMQQIPTRLPRYTELPEYCTGAIRHAFSIRTCFRAPSGYLFVKIDESQFELRALDHFAQDPAMHQAFIDGRDIHSEVACRLWNFRYDEFSSGYKAGDKEAKQFRDASKECNFAVVYGAGPKRLHSTLTDYGYKFQLSEVKVFYYRYFEVFSHIRAFIDRVQATVRRRGYIFNEYGRHKRVPANKAYVGVNYLIQGLTADMLKDAMIRIDEEVVTPEYRSELLLAVHDEVDFLIAEDEMHLIPLCVREMQNFPWCRTPIVAEVSVGPSWGELTDYPVTLGTAA